MNNLPILFLAGEIISFQSREGSFGMAKVLRVDTNAELPIPEPVYHLMIYAFRNILPPNIASIETTKPFFAHLPIMQSGIKQSGSIKIGFQEVSVLELEAYTIWREAFFRGESGVFELSIDDALAIMLEALGQSLPSKN